MAIGIGTILTVGSTLLGAFGKTKSGNAANDAAQYQARVARNNAKIARDQGKYDAAVARNNAISARYNIPTVRFFGEYNASLSEEKSKRSSKLAEVARLNVAFRRYQQHEVIDQANRRIADRRTETRQLIGTQRATLAANGVVVDEGSAASLVASSYEVGRRDQMRILADAEIDIFDLGIDAYNFEAEASSLEQEAVNYKSEGTARRYEAAVRVYDLEREAFNFDNQALFAEYQANVQENIYKEEAKLASAKGKNAKTAGYLSAAGTILGGLGRAL